MRTIIESPFAPVTPASPHAKCWLQRQGLGHDCLAHHMRPNCEWCVTTAARQRESAVHAQYLDACLLDSLRRGEAPFASHGLYTRPGVLNDLKPEERAAGIAAGFEWRQVACASAFYLDFGWSDGMRLGEADAQKLQRDEKRNAKILIPHRIVCRLLGGSWGPGMYAL